MSLDDMRRRALTFWTPPPNLDLAEWIESSLVLPSSASALPGPLRLWPQWWEIMAAIGSPSVRKIVVKKGARVSYSLSLAGFIGSCVVNTPCPVLVIVPTESDAANFVTDQLEALFDASPALRGKLSEGKRNRLLYRQFPGGWLRVVAAKAPRNLRAHSAKVVIFDEIDAFDISAGGAGKGEGNPIDLGTTRSDTFPDRKIILGGTPVDTETSHVIREYEQSSGAEFEIPCMHCGAFFVPTWGHIKWDEGRPETARLECPHCGGRMYERDKAGIVARGQWRHARPEITDVRGYALTQLTSTIPAAAFPVLAARFLKAKRSPETLKPFVNLVLGSGWQHRDGDGHDEHALAKRAEPFSLQSIPEDVRVLVAGIDVQAYGLEVLTVGFDEENAIYVLDYTTLHGDPHGDEVWQDCDSYIKQRHVHPWGGALHYDAVAVDSGDGNLTSKVYSFTRPRFGRRVISTKGHDGKRVDIEKANKPGLYTLGVDTLKARIFDLLAEEGHIRFSKNLPLRFYEELTAERRVTKYKNGHPMVSFVKQTGARNEALDTLCMAMGARKIVTVDMTARANQLRQIAQAPVQPTIVRSKWMTGDR